MGDDAFRIEHDSMGEVRVPRDALWQAQTQRAVENFPISGTPIEPQLIHALGHVKASAATANGKLGVLPADLAEAVARAAREVAEGRHDDQFPIDVFQTGSGTSSNMNANEVIASLCGARRVDVHPTTTSTPASRATTPSQPQSTSPPRSRWRNNLQPALAVLAGSLEARRSSSPTW